MKIETLNNLNIANITLGQIFNSVARLFATPFKTKIRQRENSYMTKNDLSMISKQVTNELKTYILTKN